jgi:hypothetical protein
MYAHVQAQTPMDINVLRGLSPVTVLSTTDGGKAYGLPAGSAGADAYGDSRPFQTELSVTHFAGPDSKRTVALSGNRETSSMLVNAEEILQTEKRDTDDQQEGTDAEVDVTCGGGRCDGSGGDE